MFFKLTCAFRQELNLQGNPETGRTHLVPSFLYVHLIDNTMGIQSSRLTHLVISVVAPLSLEM